MYIKYGSVGGVYSTLVHPRSRFLYGYIRLWLPPVHRGTAPFAVLASKQLHGSPSSRQYGT